MPFGQKQGSLKSLKKTLARGQGTFIKYVPKDSSMTVRFLTEPDDPEGFVGYYEHYDEVGKQSYACSGEDDCPGCKQDDRRTFRFLTNAIDTETDRVIPFQLPKSAVQSLVLKYEKYGTLVDRDYEISRYGSGLDTVYDVTPESPAKKNMKKYEALDLEKVLADSYNNLFGDDADTGDDDDDDEDEPVAKKSASKAKAPAKKAAKATKKAAPAKGKGRGGAPKEPTVVELATAADDDEDEAAMDKLVAMAEANGLDPDEYETWGDLAQDLLDADSDDEPEEEPDEEEEDDDEAEEDEAEDDDEDEDEPEEDDEESDEWTEDELKAKAIGELKAIARDYDIATKGLKKAEIITAIMEAE